MSPESGSRLGHYEILSAIGKGGMGEVWKARDTKLGREVAIKTLPPEFAEDPDRLARFEREARLLASLNHPNIAAIYGLEEHDGSRFLVMELVEGNTLSDDLKRGAIPAEESLRLALQIAEALEAAHDKGVIHRDLKPANLKITPDGKVKVLDFGLAKALAGEQSDVNLSNSPTLSMTATRAGIVMGTAAYMSPEQARGEAADSRADIWAFGCVLFEMLAGEATFEGRTVSDVLAGVLAREPNWSRLPEDLHPRVRLLLERCLEKEARDRYTGIGDARVDVEKVLADPGGVRLRFAPPSAPRSLVSLLRWPVTLGASLVLAGVLVFSSRPDASLGIVRFHQPVPEGQDFGTTGRPVLTVSPDGSRIVYAAAEQLWVRDLSSFETRPIPGTSEDPTTPFFSPDGQWVGYWSAADRQLKKIRLSGGDPVPLATATNPFGFVDWGADGGIVYSQGGAIMRVEETGGTPDLLFERPGQELGDPQILPDGESILFDVDDSLVVVKPPESEEWVELFEGNRPRYLETGHLVYERDGALYATLFDPDTLRIYGGSAPLIDDILPSQYAISDTGTLAYVEGTLDSGLQELALVSANDGSVERLPIDPGRYRNPRLSRDGTRLAVERIDDGQSAIWIYDLSGETELRRLTLTGTGNNSRPVWTADSERIAFTSDRDGTESIWWQRADNTESAVRLTEPGEDVAHYPESWSSNGILSYVQVTPGNSAIWAYSLEDGSSREIYDRPGLPQLGSTFSPDGQWIAYTSAEGDGTGSRIFVRPFPDGPREEVAQNGAVWPVWAPDGARLFYQSNPDGTSGPVLSRADLILEPTVQVRNTATTLIRTLNGRQGYRNFDIRFDDPGDDVFVVVTGSDTNAEAPSRINVVLNWNRELLERVPLETAWWQFWK